MNNLKSKILETVKNNDIRMIPKWKFVLYSSLGVVGILFTFLIVIFVMSLGLFVFSKYGLMDMPVFGFIHVINMLRAIPILLLLCTIVLLVLIEALSIKYAFAFRRPLAVTLLVITSIAVCVSFFISQTPLHSYIRDYMRSNNYDMVTRVYDRPSMPFARYGTEVLRGEVDAISPTSIVLQLFDGSLVVAYASTTITSANGVNIHNLKIGDDIILLGTFVGSSSDTFEISRLKPTHRMLPEKLHDGPRQYPRKRDGSIGTSTKKGFTGEKTIIEGVK